MKRKKSLGINMIWIAVGIILGIFALPVVDKLVRKVKYWWFWKRPGLKDSLAPDVKWMADK